MKNYRKKIYYLSWGLIFTIFSMVFSSVVVAQEDNTISAYSQKNAHIQIEKPLSLEDAIRITQQKFPQIQAAMEEQKAAEAGIEVAKTAYYPKVNIFNQSNIGNQGKLSGVLFPMTGALPIQGPVPTSQNFNYVWGTWNGMFIDWLAYDFGLRKAQVNQARTEESTAKANVVLTEYQAISDTAKAFFNLIVTKDMVKAAQANFDRAKTFEMAVSVLVKAGLKPGVDEMRAIAVLEEARTYLIQAIQQVEVAKYKLSVSMGIAGEKFEIDSKPFSDALDELPDCIMGEEIDDTHPLLEYRKKEIELVKAKQNVLKHSYLPTITLQGGLNGRGSGYDSANPTAVTSAEGSLTGLIPTRLELAAALIVNYSLTDYFIYKKKIKVEKANEKYQIAMYNRYLQELTGKLDESKVLVNSAAAMAKFTPVNVDASKAANLQVTTRYKAGLSNIVEVADVQKMLYEAEVKDVIARLKLWSALFIVAEA